MVLCASLRSSMDPEEALELRSLTTSACELRDKIVAHELALLESLRCRPSLSLEGLNASEAKQLLLRLMPTCLQMAFREFDSHDHLEVDQLVWVRGNAIHVFQILAASPHVPLLPMLNAFLHLVEKKYVRRAQR